MKKKTRVVESIPYLEEGLRIASIFYYHKKEIADKKKKKN